MISWVLVMKDAYGFQRIFEERARQREREFYKKPIASAGDGLCPFACIIDKCEHTCNKPRHLTSGDRMHHCPVHNLWKHKY